MQIKIGDKIRELRHRDGRKQEDLANALGVSNQAVSRWEANGGYPDMELLPAIANYFNVSIDELFGYSKDRDEKLKNILSKAEEALNEQGDMTECVEMLRNAAEEFPSEPRILIKLGYALSIHGWRKYGARSYTEDGSDYAHEDTEYNSANVFWQEEMRVFEKVMTMDIPADDRGAIIQMMVNTYAKMGYNEKAKELVMKQNSIEMSRECLLPKATKAEERDKYYGEAIIALLKELSDIFFFAIGTKVSLFTTAEGRRLNLALAKLYESVFSDGRCGEMHYSIGKLYLDNAVFEARFHKNVEKAFEYFCIGFAHIRKYRLVCNTGEYHYSSPLVSKVVSKSEEFRALSPTFWEGWISVFQPELVERIKADDTYAECFS
ncbi:MAG: helix-turn-helix transcriptional regulator [Clostridia bacterium]|nr:helix-turn-helix transcriptional regulator [Clostridia bacterium]